MEKTIVRRLDCPRCQKKTRFLVFYSDEENCKVVEGICIECLPPQQSSILKERIRQLEMSCDPPYFPDN